MAISNGYWAIAATHSEYLYDKSGGMNSSFYIWYDENHEKHFDEDREEDGIVILTTPCADGFCCEADNELEGCSFFNADNDVINVIRECNISDFPVVRTNRYKFPSWICRLSLKRKRKIIKNNDIKQNHPFIFHKNGEKLVLTPLDYK